MQNDRLLYLLAYAAGKNPNYVYFDLDSVPERGCAWLVWRGEGVGDVRGRAGLQVLQQPRHGDAKPAW